MKTFLAVCFLLTFFGGYHSIRQERQRIRSEERARSHPAALNEDVFRQDTRRGSLERSRVELQRDRRQTDADRVLQARAPLPDSARQPQVQPARTRREEQRTAYPAALSRDVSRTDTQQQQQRSIRRSSASSERGRDRRQTDADRVLQARAPLPDSARQPQVQPARTRREEQRTAYPAALSRDVSRTDTQQQQRSIRRSSASSQRGGDRRQTDSDRVLQARAPLPGSARQPQVQPARTRREEQRTASPAALSRDVSRTDIQRERLIRSSASSERGNTNTEISRNYDPKDVLLQTTELDGPISPTIRLHVNNSPVVV